MEAAFRSHSVNIINSHEVQLGFLQIQTGGLCPLEVFLHSLSHAVTPYQAPTVGDADRTPHW